MTEVWMRGPVDGVPAELQPVVHALMQVDEDIVTHCSALSTDDLWARPGGAASIGFHLRHLAGSADRLLTYARGEQLTAAQLATLKAEGDPGVPPAPSDAVITAARAGIAAAIAQVRATDVATLDQPRELGRKRLPTNVRGLLVHVAEHSARHMGQIVTTARIVAGLRATRQASSIADWLAEGGEGDPWHGPSVSAVLAAVDATLAAAPAPDGGHGIWALILHMTAWTREVHRRLDGSDPEEPRDGDWPAVPEPTPEAWAAAVAAFHVANRALVTTTRALGDADLARVVGGDRVAALGTGVTVATMLAGLAQHHAYHAGQIARLVRARR